MRKLLLSFFMCMLAIIGMQAEEVTLNYADVVDKGTSGGGGGFEYIVSPINFNFSNAFGASGHIKAYGGCEINITGATITKVVIKATSASNLKEWGSLDNSDVTISEATATWVGNSDNITLTNTATSQARISSIVVTYEGGGEYIDIVEPTFTPESGTEFEESLDVTINVEEGLQAFYSIGNEDNYIEGTTLTVAETTTVYAYAKDAEGNKSNVVSAKYTKNEPLAENTIVFNNQDGDTDSSSAATIDNFIDNLIKNTNIEDFTCTATSNCYKGKAGYGIKMGKSGDNGSFTLQLASAMNVESIIVNAESWGSDEAQLSVNGSDAQSLTAEFANYTFEINDEISIIKVDMTNRGYIKSLTINVANGETPGDDPVVQQLAAPTFSPAGGAVEAGTEVTITATNDATIMYKVGDDEYAAYTAPIEVTEECTITAYATKDGFEDSEVVTATYTIEQPFEPTVFGNVVDVLNFAFTGIDKSSYQNWSDKVATSGTRYLGCSHGTHNTIQLKSNDNISGIVSDRSVGTVKKVTVSWNTNTTDGRTLDVYGSNTAYTSAADLYADADATKGTLLGSIKYGTSTELVIDGDYEYIGLRSKSGAMYLDEIQIEWYVPYPETITAGMYYLVPGEWEDENVALYAAKFINKNTETSKFEQGYLNNHFVYFQLKEGEYTHVKFYQVENPDKSTTTTVIEDFAKMTVLAETPELTYTAPGAGNIMRYNVDESNWEEVEIGTGVNRVELAGGIGYAYGVVSAEGAIEVYNVNGAVVARGNDNVDLRGLGRGVYIIRNGNQVRKVVR